MRGLYIILFLIIYPYAFCQTVSQAANNDSALLMGNGINVIEYFSEKGDSDGKKTAYHIPSQLAVNVTTKDKKLSVDNLYNFQLKDPDKYFLLGLNFSAKVNNSIASVFANSDIVNGFSGSTIIGYKWFTIKNEDAIIKYVTDNIDSMDEDEIEENIGKQGQINGHWVYFSPKIEGRKFDLFVPSNEFQQELTETKETLWSLNLGYNYWTPNFYGFNTLFGVSFSQKYSDNFSRLDEITVEEQYISNNDDIQRVSSEKKTAYKGDYLASDKQGVNIEGYFVHNSFPLLGLYLGFANTFEKRMKSETTFSTGIFFTKPDQPINPSIGVVFNFKDINNNFDLTGAKRFSINLVARFNLGNAFN